MATLEHEVTTPLTIRLSREQRQTLERAAQASGQSLDEFAASALLSAADAALTASLPLSEESDPLDRVFGIFKDEPLMDALMERIRADRRIEIAAFEAEAAREAETEAAHAEAAA